MARRDARSLIPLLGRDLRLDYAWGGGFFEDADLASARGDGGTAPSRRDDAMPARRSGTPGGERDLTIVAGVDNLVQAIANRLKTRKGELASLGHPEYGSRHHELMGEPNVERTRNLIKLYVLQALRDERRIERVLQATVRAEHDPPRETVRIELSVRVIGEALPIELIVPFSLEPRL